MSVDPRAALAAFVTALERHLEAASSRRGENDPVVVAAYQDLAEAFDRYDDALMEAYGEVTPLEIYSGDDEDDGDDDGEDEEFDSEFDEDEDDSPYLGLDEEEFDAEAADDDSDDSDDLSDGEDDDADEDDDDSDEDSDEQDDPQRDGPAPAGGR